MHRRLLFSFTKPQQMKRKCIGIKTQIHEPPLTHYYRNNIRSVRETGRKHTSPEKLDQ